MEEVEESKMFDVDDLAANILITSTGRMSQVVDCTKRVS